MQSEANTLLSCAFLGWSVMQGFRILRGKVGSAEGGVREPLTAEWHVRTATVHTQPATLCDMMHM